MVADLTVVIPVYNEQECIGETLAEWGEKLESLGIDYEMMVLNDGSTDLTPVLLDEISKVYPRIRVVHKLNTGHGPTILEGYRQAEGRWVFQTDSDRELRPENFHAIWERREEYDLLLGNRVNRKSPLARRFISLVSRLAVGFLFGRGLKDVNCPFRLWRRVALERLLADVPRESFAPNVILSGLANWEGLRIYQTPVIYEARKTGKLSIMKWKLWKSAFLSFIQLFKVALRRHKIHFCRDRIA